MKKIIRLGILAAVITATMIIGASAVTAAEIVDQGSINYRDTNINWSLDSDGVLTFSGSGSLTDYEMVPCGWLNHRDSITSIIIGEGITEINGSGSMGGVFNNFTNLTNVSLPNSMTYLGSSAFGGCTSLKNVTIPHSVTSLGEYVFSGCAGLTNVTISDSVTSLREAAFSGCTSLANVTIPNSVTSIGNMAFSECTSLTNVTIPDSVTSLDGNVFSGCTSLINVTISSSVTSLEHGIFSGCTNLKSLVIPASVKSIGSRAMGGCSSLEKVVIPKSVSMISEDAFAECNPDVVFDTPTGYRAYDYARYNDFTVSHEFGSWTITKEATDSEDGLKERVCANCGEEEQEVIPRTGQAASGDLTAVEQKLADAERRLAEAEKRLADAEAAMTQISTDNTTLENQLADTEKRLSEAEQKLAENDATSSEQLTTAIEQRLAEIEKRLETAERLAVPVATTITKVTAAKKAFTVKWKKQTNIAGFQIQYSLDKKFKKGKITVTIKNKSATSKKVTKLKGATTYYVKVRTYKTIDGSKYYSPWSKVKSIKTKK